MMQRYCDCCFMPLNHTEVKTHLTLGLTYRSIWDTVFEQDGLHPGVPAPNYAKYGTSWWNQLQRETSSARGEARVFVIAKKIFDFVPHLNFIEFF